MQSIATLETLGEDLWHASFFAEAAWCFEQVFEKRSPRLPFAVWRLANIAFVRGRDREAVRLVRMMAAIEPSLAELPLLMRSIASALGNPSFGREWLLRGAAARICGASKLEKSLVDHADELCSTSAEGAVIPTRGVPSRHVLLTLGQSNAANVSSISARVVRAAAAFHSGRLFPLVDPLIGADGHGGSIWSRLAQLLLSGRHCDEVVVATAARCGSTIEDWMVRDTFSLERMCRDLITAGLGVTHVLWQQGEAETVRNTTRDAYLNGLMGLKRRLVGAGIAAPIYCALSTRVLGRVSQDVREAIEKATSTIEGVRLGPDIDLLDDHLRSDGTHLSAAGQDAAANLWLRTLVAAP